MAVLAAVAEYRAADAAVRNQKLIMIWRVSGHVSIERSVRADCGTISIDISGYNGESERTHGSDRRKCVLCHGKYQRVCLRLECIVGRGRGARAFIISSGTGTDKLFMFPQ